MFYITRGEGDAISTENFLRCMEPVDVLNACHQSGVRGYTGIISECNSYEVSFSREPSVFKLLIRKSEYQKFLHYSKKPVDGAREVRGTYYPDYQVRFYDPGKVLGPSGTTDIDALTITNLVCTDAHTILTLPDDDSGPILLVLKDIRWLLHQCPIYGPAVLNDPIDWISDPSDSDSFSTDTPRPADDDTDSTSTSYTRGLSEGLYLPQSIDRKYLDPTSSSQEVYRVADMIELCNKSIIVYFPGFNITVESEAGATIDEAIMTAVPLANQSVMDILHLICTTFKLVMICEDNTLRLVSPSALRTKGPENETDEYDNTLRRSPRKLIHSYVQQSHSTQDAITDYVHQLELLDKNYNDPDTTTVKTMYDVRSGGTSDAKDGYMRVVKSPYLIRRKTQPLSELSSILSAISSNFKYLMTRNDTYVFMDLDKIKEDDYTDIDLPRAINLQRVIYKCYSGTTTTTYIGGVPHPDLIDPPPVKTEIRDACAHRLVKATMLTSLAAGAGLGDVYDVENRLIASSVAIEDKLGCFNYVTTGFIVLAIQVCDRYFIIQACCPVETSSVSTSDSSSTSESSSTSTSDSSSASTSDSSASDGDTFCSGTCLFTWRENESMWEEVVSTCSSPSGAPCPCMYPLRNGYYDGEFIVTNC